MSRLLGLRTGTQLVARRDEMVRPFGEIDKRDATILELRDEIACVVTQRA